MNFWHIFVLLGALQGFILAMFLGFHKKGNITANRVLAILILIVSVDMLITFLYLSKYIQDLPHLISISEPFYMVLGPLLYLYTKFSTDPLYKFKKVHYLYFLPSFAELLLWIPFYFQTAEQKLHDFRMLDNEMLFQDEYRLIWTIELAYNLLYIILAAKVLVKYRHDIKNIFSDITAVSFNWLRNLIIITLVVSLGQVLIIFSSSDSDTIETYFTILYCLFAFLFYGVGYMGLKQPDVFSGNDFITHQVNQAEPDKKYAKSSLNDETAKLYLSRLLELMEDEKPYLQNNLKLKEISDRLTISSNHLSQLINEKLEKNFLDFINAYRIKEAKNMMTDKKYANLTLLAIAYDAGFSSKSVFNSVFKKHVQMTPSQYRQAKTRNNN